MKKCPFCAEEIQDEAIKCKHCAEFLDGASPSRPVSPNKPQNKWYYSTVAIAVGVATVGPFALPLVWKNPKYNTTTKMVITIAVTVLTLGLCYLMGVMMQRLMQSVLDLGKI